MRPIGERQMHLLNEPLGTAALEHRGQAMRNVQRLAAHGDTNDHVPRRPRDGARRRDVLRRESPRQRVRLGEISLDLFADRSVPRARLVHAGSQQEHVWIIRKERHGPVDVSARCGLDDSREHVHHFRFGARIGLHVVRDDSRKGGTPWEAESRPKTAPSQGRTKSGRPGVAVDVQLEARKAREDYDPGHKDSSTTTSAAARRSARAPLWHRRAWVSHGPKSGGRSRARASARSRRACSRPAASPPSARSARSRTG